MQKIQLYEAKHKAPYRSWYYSLEVRKIQSYEATLKMPYEAKILQPLRREKNSFIRQRLKRL